MMSVAASCVLYLARSAVGAVQALLTDVIWCLYFAAALLTAAWLLRVRLLPAVVRHYADVDLALTDLDFQSLKLAEQPFARLLSGDVPFDSLRFTMENVVVIVLPATPTSPRSPDGPTVGTAASPSERAPQELLRARVSRFRLQRTGPLAFDVMLELEQPKLQVVGYDLQFAETNLGWLWRARAEDRGLEGGAHTQPRAGAQAGRQAAGGARELTSTAPAPARTADRAAAAGAAGAGSAGAGAAGARERRGGSTPDAAQTRLRSVRLRNGSLRLLLPQAFLDVSVPLTDEEVPLAALSESTPAAAVRWCVSRALRIAADGGQLSASAVQALEALSRMVGDSWQQAEGGLAGVLAQRTIDCVHLASHLAQAAPPILGSISAQLQGAAAAAGPEQQRRMQQAASTLESVRRTVAEAPARIAAGSAQAEAALGEVGGAMRTLDSLLASADQHQPRLRACVSGARDASAVLASAVSTVHATAAGVRRAASASAAAPGVAAAGARGEAARPAAAPQGGLNNLLMGAMGNGNRIFRLANEVGSQIRAIGAELTEAEAEFRRAQGGGRGAGAPSARPRAPSESQRPRGGRG